jgi:hypothetical protein
MIMKKLLAVALVLSAIAGGTASARQMGPTARPYADVDVIYMNGHADMGTFDEMMTPDRTTQQQAKAELRKDPALRKALMRHDVEIRNVMAIEASPNGKTVVFVR